MIPPTDSMQTTWTTPLGRRSSDSAIIARPTQILSDPFVFVPITGGEAARGRGAAKQIVRAHVTRIQHTKSSTLAGLHSIQNWTVKPYVPRDGALSQRKQRRVDVSTKTKKQDAVNDTGEQSERRRASTAMIPTTPTGNGRPDPFWSYPIDYQPYLSPIFAHYIQNIAVEIPDIDGPNEKGLLRRSWFPLAMTDAATMYSVLLMAASHYCIVNPGPGAAVDLLCLKARALAEINAGIASKNRATTDAMIGAVAKMASYEAVFGDPNIFTAHMKGLQMLIKMRGGLSNLGLNGLLERIVVWIDFNAAHLLGMAAALGNEAFPTNVKFDMPDPFHFAGISTMS